MSAIVTLTLNPAVDTSSRVDRVAPNRKLRCEAPRREPGGGGVNVSRAIRRMEGESVAVVLAGGPTGDILLQLLEEEGVEARRVDLHAWTRENVVIREGDDDQYRFDFPGAEVAEDEWRRALELLSGLDPAPDWLVASGSLPPGVPVDLHARVGRVARELGARFVLDTSGEPLEAALEGGDVHLVKPNLRELAELVGADPDELEDPSDFEDSRGSAARRLVDDGRAEVVLVSMGSAGALLVDRDGVDKLPTPTVPIASRVGAGDSMVAGVVLGLHRGMSHREAGLHGVAAGAAAVMTPGSELCRGEDVERLFHKLRQG